jgi:membrane-bound lytic murein transglycosylase D
MPDDLKYVVIAESALRAHAGSRKGAMGFWQFLAATGRKYGLVINERMDERRNVFFSTRAAILCLRELYERFGSWALAAAAYNMGEEGLEAEILEQGTDDYYQLYLSLETQRYIFRILAVKIIFSDPARYGFILAKADYYPLLSFDTITIGSSQEIPIRIVAQAAGTYFKTIKDLNPEVRGHFYSRGEHRVRIPEGSSKGFQSRFQELVKAHSLSKKGSIYIIQEGDNLSSIAYKFGVPLAALIIWNRIDLKKPIYAGQRLVIYSKETQKGDPGTPKSSPVNQNNSVGSNK